MEWSKKNILSKGFYNEIKKDEKLNLFWEKEFEDLNIMDENNKFIYIFQKFHLCLLDRLDLMSMHIALS